MSTTSQLEPQPAKAKLMLVTYVGAPLGAWQATRNFQWEALRTCQCPALADDLARAGHDDNVEHSVSLQKMALGFRNEACTETVKLRGRRSLQKALPQHFQKNLAMRAQNDATVTEFTVQDIVTDGLASSTILVAMDKVDLE
eukprot:CAMPEP_0204478626 /NCGR_PEP_ID=MMETSP0471-20130131/33616_1 /ASSEMBLY_ACC=CAM_ASM_000602 /TAXON_ID=2969 /ORGANISM="Oxyrrhis marina" /LENGTH=141 /DNA_ID=CAMNT_0051481471 /DNA_START=722 /DNA_END=1146 /DNA_ORIENTATION=+